MTSTVDTQNDPTFAALTASVQEDIDNFKSVEAQFVAANGDREEQIDAFIKTSRDEQVIKYREALAKLTSNLREYAEQNVSTSDVSADEKDKLSKAYNEARKQCRDVIKVVRDSAKLFERRLGLPYEAAFDQWLENNGGDPTKGRAVSAGATLPKVPVYISVDIPEHDGVEAKRADFTNFSLYAQWRGVDVATAQRETLDALNAAREASGLAPGEL